jgi:3-hydroxyacyl-[acyl-carrier protein] dehydratase/trans-2-decenoyl-[acyl-carrier protein] isomerase
MLYEDFLKRSHFDHDEVLGLAWGTLVEDPPDEFIRFPIPPMLMIDRVVEISHDGPRGRIVAERDVRIDDWFFQCHFGGDPVQPGCLGVDAIWQLIGFYCGLRGGEGSGRALGCKEIEFSGQIRPHDKLVRYEIEIRRYSELKASGSAVAIGTGRVLVDGEHIYTIRDAKVGLFQGIAYPDYPHPSANSTGGLLVR